MSRWLAVALLAIFGIVSGLAALAFGSESKPVLCRGKEATVIGTEGKDRLGPGSTHPGDVVALLSGSDRFVLGHAPDVTVCGGEGADQITTGRNYRSGTILDGGPGSDSIHPGFYTKRDKPLHILGGPGGDLIHGSQADDRIVGNGSADLIGGGLGDDYIDAGGGDDLPVAGDAGDDRIDGGLGDDTIFGGHAYVYRVPPGQRDKADGGKGKDYCVVRAAVSCERNHPVK